MLLLWSFRICLVPVVLRNDVAMQVAVVTFILQGYVFIPKVWSWIGRLSNHVDAVLTAALLLLLLAGSLAAGVEADTD